MGSRGEGGLKKFLVDELKIENSSQRVSGNAGRMDGSGGNGGRGLGMD